MQFILGFCRLVECLFIFIESIRTCNWIQHLNAAESLLPDYASLDHLKYCRMWAVYIGDMQHLEQDDPAVWSAFLEGDFCSQKTEIPGRDHAGEQKNKKIKNRGGISGRKIVGHSTFLFHQFYVSYRSKR